MTDKRSRSQESLKDQIPLSNKFDDWNLSKRDFAEFFRSISKQNPIIMGIGAPMRHPTYILGKPPTQNEGNRSRGAHSSGSAGANAGNSYAESSY